MPPPPLSSSTIVSSSPSRRAASRPPMSCASATSPISSTTGPAPAAAAPKAEETVPSMPLAPRLQSTRGGSVADRPEGLDVAHRHRGGDEQRRLLRQQHAELGRPPRARRGAWPSSTAPIASAARSSAPAPARPATSALRRACRRAAAARRASFAHSRAQRGGGLERQRAADDRAGSCHAPSGSSATWARRSRAPPASCAAAWRPAGRRPAAPGRAGARRRSLGRAAARRSGRPRPSPRRAPDSGSASSGQPAARGEASRPRPSEPVVALVAPGDEHAPAGAGDELAQLLPRRRRGRAGRRRGARRGAPSARPLCVVGELLVADQRLAQREVQVHRPGPALERGPVGAAGERADPAQLLGAAPRAATTSKNHLAALAEQLQLVDRLPGAVLAQLGGAVGGQHQQRHPRLARLDHGRQQLRRRGSRRAGDGRPAGPMPWRGRARRSPRSARRRGSGSAGAARARARAPAARSASRARCTPRASRSARARRRTPCSSR